MSHQQSEYFKRSAQEEEEQEEIRKHLAPWRQILLEIVDQVEQERKLMKERKKLELLTS